MKASRKTLVSCGIAIVAALGAGVLWQARFGPLPFDSAAWRQDYRGDSGMRWRMRADALRRLKAGEIATAGEMERLLGPNVRRAMFHSYRLGNTFPPIDSWWLDVALDAQGRVMPAVCGIHPD